MEEAFSGARLSMAYVKPTFPLPKGYFADVEVGDEQAREYRQLVRDRLDTVLADERCCLERRANGLPPLNPRNWAAVQSLDGLHVFRRRQRGRSSAELASDEDFHQAMGAVANGQPSIMTIGSIPGTIEDVLYGFAGTTDEEARTSMSFLARKTDATILTNMELATDDDPLHFLGLKWLYLSKAMCSPRDLCCLQATGTQVDASGRRYGYLLLHSVELPECPPFDRKRSHIIRGKVFFTCILRETTPGFVDLLARGIFDMAGDDRRPLAKLKSTSCIGLFTRALHSLTDCSDAKKLTLLARHTASQVDVGDSRRQLPPPPKHAVCVVCMRRNGSGLFPGLRLHACRICGMPVCSKCSVNNKRVFLGGHRPWSVVPCCPACALEAHRVTDVRPSESEFAVVSDYFTPESASRAKPARATSIFTLPAFLGGHGDHGADTSVDKDLHGANDDSCIDLSTEEKESDCFSELSDLDASQVCPSSGSNASDSSHEEARAADKSEPLPAVVEELLKTDDAPDSQREQADFTQRFLQAPGEPSATRSRITICDFRRQVGDVMTTCDRLMAPRERNRSEGMEIPEAKCNEFAAKLQELQSTADQIYGEVVTQRTEM